MNIVGIILMILGLIEMGSIAWFTFTCAKLDMKWNTIECIFATIFVLAFLPFRMYKTAKDKFQSIKGLKVKRRYWYYNR